LLQEKGDLATAEPLLRRVLEPSERIFGPEYPDTLASLDSLARLLHEKGDLAEAEPLARRSLAASERALGPEHPDTVDRARVIAHMAAGSYNSTHGSWVI
jgi:hypothetical protein